MLVAVAMPDPAMVGCPGRPPKEEEDGDVDVGVGEERPVGSKEELLERQIEE